MLAKKYRLPIHKIYKLRGRIFGNNYFSVKIIKNNLAFSRFGVVVGAKISKKAVVRNKLRRLIFNTIKENYKNFSKTGLDMLIIAKPPVSNLSKQEIKNNILDFLKNV